MSDPLTAPGRPLAPDELQPLATPLAVPGDAEAAAWADVEARWDDPGAHAAYLAGCTDLDALTRAGGRYRAVLKARPGDAVAQRYRDEIIKRATIVGLASLPRTAPKEEKPAWMKWVFRSAAMTFGSLAAWAAWKLAAALLGGPQP